MCDASGIKMIQNRKSGSQFTDFFFFRAKSKSSKSWPTYLAHDAFCEDMEGLLLLDEAGAVFYDNFEFELYQNLYQRFVLILKLWPEKNAL